MTLWSRSLFLCNNKWLLLQWWVWCNHRWTQISSTNSNSFSLNKSKAWLRPIWLLCKCLSSSNSSSRFISLLLSKIRPHLLKEEVVQRTQITRMLINKPLTVGERTWILWAPNCQPATILKRRVGSTNITTRAWTRKWLSKDSEELP